MYYVYTILYTFFSKSPPAVDICKENFCISSISSYTNIISSHLHLMFGFSLYFPGVNHKTCDIGNKLIEIIKEYTTGGCYCYSYFLLLWYVGMHKTAKSAHIRFMSVLPKLKKSAYSPLRKLYSFSK